MSSVSSLDQENVKNSFFLRIFLFVCIIHLSIFWFVDQDTFIQKKAHIPKKLLIHTISLKNSPRTVESHEKIPDQIKEKSVPKETSFAKDEAPSEKDIQEVIEKNVITTSKSPVKKNKTDRTVVKKETKRKEVNNQAKKKIDQTKKVVSNTPVKKIAPKESDSKKTSKKEQELLDSAMKSLQKAKDIDAKKSRIQRADASFKNSISNFPTRMETLHVDEISNDASCEPTKGEKSYYDELIKRLQLALTLPEYGDVKISLTLSKQGKVLSIKQLQSKSSLNSSHVEKTVKQLQFPPFGQHFPHETEHTFHLNLSNELF